MERISRRLDRDKKKANAYQPLSPIHPPIQSALMLYSKIDTGRPRPQRFSPPLQNSCMLRPPSLPSLPFPADCAMHKPFIAPTRATFCRAESKRRRRYIRQDSGGGKATLVGFAISRWRTDGGKGGRLGWRSPLAFMAKGRREPNKGRRIQRAGGGEGV